METTERVGPEATPDVDEDRLAALEQDLADAAAALAAIEDIAGSDLPPLERVSAISALTADGRFDVEDVDVDAPVDTDQPGDAVDTRAGSDLIGDSELGTFEQLEAVAEGELTVD